MNELLELKHRIDNCTDDLNLSNFERFMTNSLSIYGNLKKNTLSEMQSMALPLQ